jgi:hypothetical protein
MGSWIPRCRKPVFYCMKRKVPRIRLMGSCVRMNSDAFASPGGTGLLGLAEEARSSRPGPQRSQAGAVRTANVKHQCKAPTHNGLTQTVMSGALHWPGTVLSKRGVVKPLPRSTRTMSGLVASCWNRIFTAARTFSTSCLAPSGHIPRKLRVE